MLERKQKLISILLWILLKLGFIRMNQSKKSKKDSLKKLTQGVLGSTPAKPPIIWFIKKLAGSAVKGIVDPFDVVVVVMVDEGAEPDVEMVAIDICPGMLLLMSTRMLPGAAGSTAPPAPNLEDK